MAVAIISKGTVNIPTGTKKRSKGSTKLANAMALELLNYGILADRDLLDRIATHKKSGAREICNSILKMHTIGNINPPLFPQWESRTEFTFSEFVVQILGYMVQLSGNDLEDPSYMETLRDTINFGKVDRLSLAGDNKSLKRFKTLVSSTVALDRKSLNDLVLLAEQFPGDAPKVIRSAEARIAVVLGLVKSGLSLRNALINTECGIVDVLRYAAAVQDFEGTKLPANVQYANLRWRDRLYLMSHLSAYSFDDLCEAMGTNRQAWTRFFRHFHVFQQPEFRASFAKVVAAAFVSKGTKLESIPKGPVLSYVKLKRKFYDTTDSGNLAYRTFASRVQTAVNDKDFEALKAEVQAKPDYLFRNLGSLSNVCTRETESKFVELVRSLIDKPKIGVLLSLIQIDVNSDYRIIDSKGNTTVVEADYSPIIGEIQGLAEREIYRRHGFDGHVEVSSSLRNKVVPFLSTNAELDRGTRVPFEDADYLYFLMHWVQNKGRRTDLDHSYVCLDSEWKAETVYFGRQVNSYITQSGDITNAPAPRGGTEYGRIDLRAIPDRIRYIVPIINVFSGDVFSDNEVAYAGFMFSDEPTFSLQRKHTRYDLSQPANSNIPFVIDIQKRELIIVDFNNEMRNGLTAHSSIGEIKKVISALKTKKFMTIERFAHLLSGDLRTTSLSITEDGAGKNNIAPENLSKLVS